MLVGCCVGGVGEKIPTWQLLSQQESTLTSLQLLSSLQQMEVFTNQRLQLSGWTSHLQHNEGRHKIHIYIFLVKEI